MKKNLLLIVAFVAMFIAASCSGDKVNPLWGMWTLQGDQSGTKTEIMFTDDYTGFVIINEDVQYETSWQQDSLLRVSYFEMASGNKSLGVRKTYSIEIDGNTLTMKETGTGAVSTYKRYVE